MTGRLQRGLYFLQGAAAIRRPVHAIRRGEIERGRHLLSPLRSSAQAPLAKGAISAAVRGARNAEAHKRWLAACSFWVVYNELTGDTYKALRNMVRCAHAVTAERVDADSVAEALRAWELIAALDPHSAETRQGFAWCYAGLARFAERDGQFRAAREHWSKLLEFSPQNAEALEGMRRTLWPSGMFFFNAGGIPDASSLRANLKKAVSAGSISGLTAGGLLLEAGAPELALELLNDAFMKEGTDRAASSLLSCLVALERYEDAAAVLANFGQKGDASKLRSADLQALLTNAALLVSGDVLQMLAQAEASEHLAPVLLPHLMKMNNVPAAVSLADRASPESAEWPEGIVLATGNFLRLAGEADRALRLLAIFSHTEKVAKAFEAAASSYAPEELECQLFRPGGPQFEGLCIALVEYHLKHNAARMAMKVLHSLESRLGNPAEAFHKGRLARIISILVARSETGAERIEIARVVISWLPPRTRQAFAAVHFTEFAHALSNASAFHNAPITSRLGGFREDYFEHHLERRQNQDPQRFATKIGFGETAIRYFESMSKLTSHDNVPVPASMRARLSEGCLSFGDGHSADVLLGAALVRESPSCDLRSETVFDDIGRWYTDRFMPAHGIPSGLLAHDLISYFNATVVSYAALGVTVTHFSKHILAASDPSKPRYDPGNALDALFLTLMAIPEFLLPNPSHRKLFAGMLPAAPLGGPTFADLCIALLSGASAASEPFSSLLSFNTSWCPPRHYASPVPDSPKSVLLIGHGGEGTGLSRNSRMLKAALEGGDISLTALSYELKPEAFAKALKAWREGCRSAPLVIVAVNAQDVPEVFIRDRHRALESCPVAGFFLWETSKVPRVQRLGTRLVDEVWAPTHYVANIYAASAPVHVVGKGLFPESTWPDNIAGEQRGTLRFVTVFDFHSSIERKNPLAAVLAFQRAFTGDERVELVLKASNVDTQHPGNASGQWERLCAASAGDKRIRIVTKRYTERQMQQLMRDTNCVVSLHRSEGFGYVLSDALAVGTPVIATDYSGNTDFCDHETSFPVSYRLVPVAARGALWEDHDTYWAEPDIQSAAIQMRRVYEDYPAALRKAALGRENLQARYSMERFAVTLRERLSALAERGGIDPMATVH